MILFYFEFNLLFHYRFIDFFFHRNLLNINRFIVNLLILLKFFSIDNFKNLFNKHSVVAQKVQIIFAPLQKYFKFFLMR